MEKPYKLMDIKMRTYEGRLSTFDAWPVGHVKRKEDMAAAGFYHIGIKDSVKCIECESTLTNFTSQLEDPWIEHARASTSTRCEFLRQQKGLAWLYFVKYSFGIQDDDFDDDGFQMQIDEHEREWNSIQESMDKPMQFTLRSLGFSHAVVKNAFRTNRQDTGQDFKSLTDMLDAVYSAEMETDLERLRVPEQYKTFKSLETKYEDLITSRQCKICLDKEATHIYLPCAHAVACNECAHGLSKCPVCRANVEQVKKCFI